MVEVFLATKLALFSTRLCLQNEVNAKERAVVLHLLFQTGVTTI